MRSGLLAGLLLAVACAPPPPAPPGPPAAPVPFEQRLQGMTPSRVVYGVSLLARSGDLGPEGAERVAAALEQLWRCFGVAFRALTFDSLLTDPQRQAYERWHPEAPDVEAGEAFAAATALLREVAGRPPRLLDLPATLPEEADYEVDPVFLAQLMPRFQESPELRFQGEPAARALDRMHTLAVLMEPVDATVAGMVELLSPRQVDEVRALRSERFDLEDPAILEDVVEDAYRSNKL